MIWRVVWYFIVRFFLYFIFIFRLIKRCFDVLYEYFIDICFNQLFGYIHVWLQNIVRRNPFCSQMYEKNVFTNISFIVVIDRTLIGKNILILISVKKDINHPLMKLRIYKIEFCFINYFFQYSWCVFSKTLIVQSYINSWVAIQSILFQSFFATFFRYLTNW